MSTSTSSTPKLRSFRVTDIRSWKECRRKFYFEKVLRLKPRTVEGEIGPTIWGKLGHSALEVADLTGRSPVECFFEEVQKQGISIDKEENTLWTSILSEYERHHKEMQGGWSNVQTEVNLSWTLPNGVELGGQIDKAGDYQARKWIKDYKFYKRAIKPKILQLDYQMSAYLFLWKKNFPTDMLAGAFYVVIIKKAPLVPEPLKNGRISTAKTVVERCTYDSYLQGIVDAGIDPIHYQTELEFLAARTEHPLISTEIVRRNPEEIENFEAQVIEETNDMMRCESPDQYYPNPGDHCSWCPFFTLCKATQGGNVTEQILDMYEKKQEGER